MTSLGIQRYEKYRRFSAFSQAIEAVPDAAEWACVIMFYSAMHLLDAYFTRKQFPFRVDSHPLRNRALGMCPELNRMAPLFRQLHHRSEQVRYDAAFLLRPEEYQETRSQFSRVIAILEPKVKKRLSITS